MPEPIRTNSYAVPREPYLRAMWNRRLWRPVGGVGGLIFVLLLLASTQYGSAPLVGGLPVLAIYLMVIVAARYLVVRRNVYSRVGRKSFDEARTMEFTEEGLHIETEGGAESRLPWGHLASAEIRGPYLLLFTNAIVHFIVPLSAFANDADRQAALELVRRRELLPPQ